MSATTLSAGGISAIACSQDGLIACGSSSGVISLSPTGRTSPSAMRLLPPHHSLATPASWEPQEADAGVDRSLCQLLQAACHRRLQLHFLATALLALPKQQSHAGIYAACTQLASMRCLHMYMLILSVVLIRWPSACHVLLLFAPVTAPPALDGKALYLKSVPH